MKRTIPEYLADANNLVVTVVITSLFSIAFLTVYTPFSETSWFDLHKPATFILTVGLVSTAILLVIISRVIMFYRHKKKPLKTWAYILWNVIEMILVACLYTGVTTTLIEEDARPLNIFLKALLITFTMMAIPYSIILAVAVQRDRNRILRVVSSSDIVSDESPKKNDDVIHITDNNGNLKLSVRLSNLLYIESQDNYVKVYFTSQEKLQSYLIRRKLKTIEENFSGGKLVRCHRSYIVNVSKVKVFRKENNSYVIDLDHPGTTPIPVSKKYFESFANSMKE